LLPPRVSAGRHRKRHEQEKRRSPMRCSSLLRLLEGNDSDARSALSGVYGS
jgi:hypothetical protein